MTTMASSKRLYQQLIIISALFFISSQSSYAFIAVSSPHQSKRTCARRRRRRRRSNDNDNDNDKIILNNRYHGHRTTTTIRLQVRPSFSIDDITDDRFIDIRTALDRMNILQHQQQDDGGGDDNSGEQIMKDFQRRIQKVVSCRESSIQGAGQGLFATKNIKAGTVIGFYPVHGIGVDFNDDTSSSICFGITPEDQKYFDDSNENNNNNNSNNNNGSKANYIQYLIGSRKLGEADYGPDTQLFVDINPDRIEKNNHDGSDISNCWISHYINDGAVVTTNSEMGMLDYYTESKRKKNCVHIPFGPAPIIATVTTRKVKKGEELFTSYGCIYWAESIIKEDECVVDVTDSVQIKAKETAQDIFTAWKNSQTIHESQQIQLQESFERI
jgi:hypothetical protein